MTDTSAQERARAEELLCDLLDYAKATGLPSPNLESDIERVAAALTEAKRQSAEEAIRIIEHFRLEHRNGSTRLMLGEIQGRIRNANEN